MTTSKTHTFLFRLLLIPLIAMLTANLSVAEDDEPEEEELPFPTQREILVFYEKYVPASIALFEQVRKNEGKEGYEDVLADAGERLLTYREIARENEEMAELFLAGVRVGLEIDVLIHQYHEVDETRAQQRETKAALKKKLRAQLEISVKTDRAQIKLMRKEADDLEKEVNELEANPEASVEAELEDLIFGDEDEDEDED